MLLRCIKVVCAASEQTRPVIANEIRMETHKAQEPSKGRVYD
jgi:hypothetical protein